MKKILLTLILLVFLVTLSSCNKKDYKKGFYKKTYLGKYGLADLKQIGADYMYTVDNMCYAMIKEEDYNEYSKYLYDYLTNIFNIRVGGVYKELNDKIYVTSLPTIEYYQDEYYFNLSYTAKQAKFKISIDYLNENNKITVDELTFDYNFIMDVSEVSNVFFNDEIGDSFETGFFYKYNYTSYMFFGKKDEIIDGEKYLVIYPYDKGNELTFLKYIIDVVYTITIRGESKDYTLRVSHFDKDSNNLYIKIDNRDTESDIVLEIKELNASYIKLI